MNAPISLTQRQLPDFLLRVALRRPVFVWGPTHCARSTRVGTRARAGRLRRAIRAMASRVLPLPVGSTTRPVGSLAATPNELGTDAGAARTTGPPRRPRIGTPRPRNGRRAARAGRGSPDDVEQGHGESAPANPRGLRASPKDRRPRASRGAGSSRDRIGGARRLPRAKVAPALRIPIGRSISRLRRGGTRDWRAPSRVARIRA